MRIRGLLYWALVLGLGAAPLWAEEVITLQQAWDLALASDERIEIQRLDAAIAGREVSRAWTIISPRLSASARYERPEDEIRRNGQVVVPEDSWRATITARQPVFDGRVLPARRLGLSLEGAETQQLAFVIRSSLFSVTSLYYDVLTALKQLEIAEQTLDLSTREVDRARARFDAGEARRTEFLRAEVDQARARRNLVAARNTYDVTRSDLARRMGLSADYAFVVEPPPAEDKVEVGSLAELREIALSSRNDLVAARKLIYAAEEQATVIRREGWPTLEIEFNHRFVDPESFANQNNAWDVAAIARYEFWDGGSRRISRRQQEDRIEQARLRVRDLEKSIELEVQLAVQDLRTLRENLAALIKEVSLAEENYRTLSEQARVGLATSLDVSTALNALDQARTERAREEFALAVAKQRLQQAIGLFASDYIEVEGE